MPPTIEVIECPSGTLVNVEDAAPKGCRYPAEQLLVKAPKLKGNVMKIVDKVWGCEHWITNTPEYCTKKLVLKKGWQCSLHHHKIKDETFVIASGQVLMEIGESVSVMYPFDSVRIEPGVKHRFSGIEDSVIFESSTHHEDDDSYRDEVSGRMPV